MQNKVTPTALRGFSVIFVLLLLYMMLILDDNDGTFYSGGPDDISSSGDHPYLELPPFEPKVNTDFPTVKLGSAKIPHIIHQIFKTENIPSAFVRHIRSFIAHNPDWTYYFWTDESARRLIENRYPHLLTMWQNYGRDINRVDALRYIIIYEYGGVYADLDVENFRPLHRATMKYSCIFPPDSFENSAIAHKLPFLLSNAIFLCRPKHPFLKLIIDRLPQFQSLAEEVDSTGNSFLTSQFLAYNDISIPDLFSHTIHNNSNAPHISTRSHHQDIQEDAVYLPNTAYFMSSVESDGLTYNDCKRICSDFENLSVLAKRACLSLLKKQYSESKNFFTFTKHHRKKSYYRPNWFLNSTVPVTKIVKHRKLYNPSN